jgi:hypothetical protein
MRKKQKYVTVFVVLLFCVLARASGGGGCLNASVSDRNACLRAQGDDAYNRAVDYFTRGASYIDSNDSGRAFAQLNLSKTALLEANSSYSSMIPVDPQLSARVTAAYLQVSERMRSGNASQPAGVGSSESSSSTTLMAKVPASRADDLLDAPSPSGNQILFVAAAILLLSVVGVLLLKKRG